MTAALRQDCETVVCGHRTYRAIGRPWSELVAEMATDSLPGRRRCVGRCGRTLDGQSADVCVACWSRLPFAYRQPIASSFMRDPVAHSAAMATAAAWFERHLGVRT